jgi:hypothetical protein
MSTPLWLLVTDVVQQCASRGALDRRTAIKEVIARAGDRRQGDAVRVAVEKAFVARAVFASAGIDLPMALDDHAAIAFRAAAQFGSNYFDCERDAIVSLEDRIWRTAHSSMCQRILMAGIDAVLSRTRSSTANDIAVAAAAAILARSDPAEPQLGARLHAWYQVVRGEDRTHPCQLAAGNLALALAALDYTTAAGSFEVSMDLNVDVVDHRCAYARWLLNRDVETPIRLVQAHERVPTWGHAYAAAALADQQALAAITPLRDARERCADRSIGRAIDEAVQRLERGAAFSVRDRMVWLLGTKITKDLAAGTDPDNVFLTGER